MNDAERNSLLRRLTELDFMTVDLGLFLDTHPTDEEAIKLYNKIIRAADSVRAKYEKEAGPVCSFSSLAKCDNAFEWIENPWPWESEFNFEIKSEVCQ